ncbi:bifunctional lysylphosphatidylglycerol flippase/synthetase MprF [Microbacterium sp. P03]|uniref:bifunctional lysylphosphatidylglycerol flippase/synthetase MprF n=1 Tax=Microbacterium sp. P03 TaxID=3366946 RepID=UPI00374771E3
MKESGGRGGLSGVTARALAAVALADLRRRPVTIGFTILTVLATATAWAVAGGFPQALAAGPTTIYEQGRWWAPLTALLVSDSPIDLIASALLIVVFLGFAEKLLGPARTIWIGLSVGATAILVSSALQAALWQITDLRPVEGSEMPVLDPTIATVAVIMAATPFASALWRRRTRVTGFAALAMFALYAGDADSWYRLIAALVGLAVGVVLFRRTGEIRSPLPVMHRSSTRETRSLVAAIVAVTGLGPVAALIAGGGRGPLSLAVASFGQFNDELVERCTERYLPLCDHQFALLVTRGAGPAVMALVPVALLVIAAWGLRRGRRSAFILAVATNVALILLAVGSLWAGTVVFDADSSGTWPEYALWVSSSLLLPLAVTIVLWSTSARFRARAPRQAVARFAATVGVAFAVCAGTFLVVESFSRRAFDTPPRVVDLLVETVRRFIPPVFLQSLGQPPYPRTGAALLTYQWVGVAFWAVVAIAMFRLYRATRLPEAVMDERLFRALLRRGYGGSLGFLGTWPGTLHWFSDDLQSAVAYRVHRGVAIAVGDPVCAPEQSAQTIRSFAEFCVHQGWTPVFYSIHDDFLPTFDEMGWSHMSVGEETLLDLRSLDTSAKKWSKVRYALNRAEREGVRAEWTTWHDLPVTISSQIVEISEQWVAEKSLPEMGFTLGSLDELRDDDVRLLVAIDPHDRVQAVTSWLPSWSAGAVDGWTLDFMRRRDDSPNGMMEFLLAKAAQLMQNDGVSMLSLSGAPLATKPATDAETTDASPTAVTVFLGWMARVLEPAYGFASLFRFKSKFSPSYRSLHLAYADPLTLPSVGSALAQAYLPTASSRQYVALARTLLGASR